MRWAVPAGFRERTHHPRGFALIASLTLLALLAMLACCILAQVASLNRFSTHDVILTQARQQALIGLDAAIAELQEALGPDQRISARSAILADEANGVPPHLLGVWDSWNAPLYGKLADGRSIGSTYSPGRRSMFRRWLISSRTPEQTRDFDAAAQLSCRKPGERICLLGEGTLGKEAPRSHHVYADLFYMPLESRTRGGFAWWVSGENQKASISVPRAAGTRYPVEALRRTWDTPAAMPVDYLDARALPAAMEQADKLVSVAGLALLRNEEMPQAGTPWFSDYTTTSCSLLTNAAHGGLKQDLCLLLNKESLDKTPFAPTGESDAPLVPEPWLPQRNMRIPIGSWQTLHAYYNCWPNASQKDEHVTTRLVGSVREHHTRLGGSVFDSRLRYDAPAAEAGESTYLDLRSRQRGDAGAGYARSPVMLAYLCNVAMGVEKLESGENQLSLYYSPLFLWWNPYNVPMRIGGRRMWAVAAPFKTMPLESFADIGQFGRRWSGYGMVRANESVMAGGVRKVRPELGFMSSLDGGEYFQNSLHDAYEDIVFRPGEVLIFTPGKNKFGKGSTGEQSAAPGENPWIPGYQADTVATWYSPMYRSFAAPEQIRRQTMFGLRLGCSPERLTDSRLMAGGVPDCITVAHGFGGISSAAPAPHPLDAQVNDISSEKGKLIHSPQRFLLDWFGEPHTAWNRILTEPMNWAGDVQSLNQAPYYVASIGVVAKSANPSVDSAVYRSCDFRTKHWLHSSPAFWGASIRQADHQQRQYHPYQLAVLPVSGGMLASPVSSVGRNGTIGINESGEQVSFAAVSELPVHPPFSLAGFAGMRLHPGWFRTPPGENAPQLALQRMQYQSGVPGVGIGNSFADPCLPPDKVYISHSEKDKPLTLQNEFYDHALLVNDALWDRWFCSSVSDMPSDDGKRTIPARYTLEQFLKGRNTLPVSRYVRAGSSLSSEKALKRIMQGDGWKIIAAHLMVNGGFNVNSTSVAAWKAVLQGLAARQLVTAEGGRLRMVEPKKHPLNVTFSRFMLSTTDKSTDSVGSYSPMQGSETFRPEATPGTTAWSEVRMLTPADIARLAEEMVRQVKARGPFLSMSDFINRRLDEKGGDAALKGALQAAIDRTDINRDFREVQVTPQQGSLYRFPKAEQGDLHTAAPGYLIQSDVLASLGNILTVRDDTFTVRAYGCVRNDQGAVLSQCWCEATVQRSIDYVDPTDSPTAAEFSTKLKHTGSLSRINRVFGRRMRITSFKWLDCWDL
ncbi:MAG: hypothetical protein IJN23_02010 [Akkermansia sp.]|nr:hypothetical protein [Akkermansia sp.]